MRVASKERTTKETRVRVKLNLDGTGEYDINIQAKPDPHELAWYLTHYLENFTAWSLYDLNIKAEGSDIHHVYEDVALTLGEAFYEAVGEKKGIRRSASHILDFEGNKAKVNVDISGRSYCKIKTQIQDPPHKQMVNHFFRSFASRARIDYTAEIEILDIEELDDHHQAEALFKATGKALGDATSIDQRIKERVPSTKETLTK